jgi:hypothetical protein
MWWPSDNIIEVFKEHLIALRDERDDAAGQIILSRQMIRRSYALLRIGDKIEAEQRLQGKPASSFWDFPTCHGWV